MNKLQKRTLVLPEKLTANTLGVESTESIVIVGANGQEKLVLVRGSNFNLPKRGGYTESRRKNP